MSSLTAFVFARGGSKGLPGKNIRPLAGKPLIGHAVEAALNSRAVGRVVVSTDDEAIAAAAIAHGAEAPFRRPPELASDTAPEWLAWRHAVDEVERLDGAPLDLFVAVPATAPLRLPEDIDRCVDRFRQGDVDVVFTVAPARANPWFNMVTLDEDGHAALVNRPEGAVTRRQAAPACYDIIPACYVTTPAFIRAANGLFEGRVGGVVLPRERAVDIDDLTDFRIAEALWPRP